MLLKHTPFLALLAVLISTASVLSLTTPSTALSADIVTCGDDVVVEYRDGNCPSGKCICYTGECSVCDAQTLAWNVLNWLISIAIIIAALLFVNAGVLYVMSPSNPGNIARAHKIFTNTLIGLVIILSAWLLIDLVMKSLFNENAGDANYGPWNNFLCSDAQYTTYCVDQMDKIEITGGTPGLTGGGYVDPVPPAGNGPAPSGNIVRFMGIPCKHGCSADGALVGAIARAQTASGQQFTITEACPLTRQHKAACHATCTCVDLDVFNATSQNVMATTLALREQGLRPVYETNNYNEFLTLATLYRQQGLNVSPTPNVCTGYQLCYFDNGWITGAHWSVYLN
jgi:hypothetical protein